MGTDWSQVGNTWKIGTEKLDPSTNSEVKMMYCQAKGYYKENDVDKTYITPELRYYEQNVLAITIFYDEVLFKNDVEPPTSIKLVYFESGSNKKEEIDVLHSPGAIYIEEYNASEIFGKCISFDKVYFEFEINSVKHDKYQFKLWANTSGFGETYEEYKMEIYNN